MLFLQKPNDFSPKFHVSSCFCEFEGSFLLLKRHDDKDEGNKWGIPAGKIDSGEQPLAAATRELLEETGIERTTNELTYLFTTYVRYPQYDFIFEIFSTTLGKPTQVVINPQEHKTSRWVSPQASLELDLVKDFDECIRLKYFPKEK